MYAFKIILLLFFVSIIQCKSAARDTINEIKYYSFKMNKSQDLKQIHSINYCYDFENSILYYRNNFTDTILYFYNTISFQIDSLITPKLNKSSMVTIGSQLYIIDFITSVENMKSEVVLYKRFHKKISKINTFQYVNDKGYPEIDMFTQVSDSLIVANDLNNNLIYTLSKNSAPIFQSKIISLDSLKDSIEYKWNNTDLVLEFPRSSGQMIINKSKIEVNISKKYSLFSLQQSVFILGSFMDELRVIQLTNEKTTSLDKLFAVKIPCFGPSVKLSLNGAVWICNGKINILSW